MSDKESKVPARVKVDVRIKKDGLVRVDAMSKERGISRSEMLRIMIGYSVQNMPKDWGKAL